MQLLTATLANVLFFSVIVLIMYMLIKVRLKWYVTILASLAFLVPLLMLEYNAKGPDGKRIDIVAAMKADKKAEMAKTLQVLKEQGVETEKQEGITAFYGVLDKYVIERLYGWGVVNMLFMALLCYMVARLYLVRKMAVQDGFPPFAFWRGNEFLAWGLILNLAAILPQNFVQLPAVARAVADNAIVVFGVTYFVFGVAVLNYLLTALKAGIFMRILTVIVLFISFLTMPFLAVIIVLTGVLDTWFNFRKL